MLTLALMPCFHLGRRCFAFGLAVALILSTLGAAAERIALPPKESFHLFLLAGQSNMAGRGEVAAVDREPHPRVLTLNQAGEWVPAVDPIHFDKPDVVGVGLGRTFALELVKHMPGITIGLVPAAVGGSPIDSWEPGFFYAPTKSRPWDDALARTRRALRDGTLKGILWHQGESDSKPELATSYEAKLHRLIARFRDEFQSPHLPFIAGQMGEFSGRAWDDARRQVDRAHRELPQKVLCTAFVRADGLKDKGDSLHFDAASYRELGRRYAEAYRQLLSQPPAPAERE